MLSCSCQGLLRRNMDWATFRGQHSFAQAFAECWVGMDSLSNLIDSEFATHSHRVFADEIGGVRSDDVGAEYFTVFTDDYFGESVGLIHRNRLTISRPGEAIDTRLRVFFFGLCLSQSDKGDFREGVDGVWHNVVVHDRLVSSSVVGGNLAFGRSDMGQPSAMDQVTDSIDTGEVRLHLFVDAHASPVVIETLLHQLLKAGSVSAAADGDQHIFSSIALLPFFCAGGNLLFIAFVSD